jgi:hypothetical protein
MLTFWIGLVCGMALVIAVMVFEIARASRRMDDPWSEL